MRYELLCDKCGRSYPVETRQAGGTIECECGAALSIPTMLKMKRLPEWNEAKESGETPAEQEPQTLDSANASEPAEVETPVEERAEPSRPSRRKKLSSKRRALFCFCAVIVIGSLFVVGKNLKTPPPTQVFYKNTVYSLGDGRAIKRDTTPITMEDYSFYFATDFSDPSLPTALVNDYYIDYMPPFEA